MIEKIINNKIIKKYYKDEELCADDFVRNNECCWKFQWKVENDRGDRSKRIRCLIIAVACTYFRSFFPRTYVCAEFCVVAVISISRGVPCFFSPTLFALCLFLINVRRFVWTRPTQRNTLQFENCHIERHPWFSVKISVEVELPFR